MMNASEIWHNVVKQAIKDEKKRKPVDIAPVDKAAIRQALRQSRRAHTVRVKSKLP